MDEADNGKSFAENFGNSVRKRARDEEGIEAQVKELKEKLTACEFPTCDTCGLVHDVSIYDVRRVGEHPPPGLLPCGCGKSDECFRLICCGLFGCRAEWERVRLCSSCGTYLSSKCLVAKRCGEDKDDGPYDCGKIFCYKCCFSISRVRRGVATCDICSVGEQSDGYCLKHVKSVGWLDEDVRTFNCQVCAGFWSQHDDAPFDVNWKPAVPSEMHALILQIQKAALAHMAAKKRATLHLNHLQNLEAALIKDYSIQKCPHCEAYLANGLCRRCRWIDFD